MVAGGKCVLEMVFGDAAVGYIDWHPEGGRDGPWRVGDAGDVVDG
jgi:hypothetical protein